MMRRIGIAVGCGLLGLSIHALPIPIVGPLLLGRAVTLPVAIMFGPWLGLLAAAIGCAPLITTQGWVVLFIPGEALAIGALARRGAPVLVVGAAFWSAAATAFILAPDLFGFGYVPQTVWPLALQAVMARFVAIVIADLVIAGASANRFLPGGPLGESLSLRAYAFHAFVLAAVLPVLLLASIDSQLTARKQERD